MRRLRANRCGDDADDCATQHGGQIDIAQAGGRQAGGVHAGEDVADGAADSNGEANGGGGADGVAYRDVAPEEEGDGDSAAADGDQCAQPSGECAGERHACDAGQLARGVRLHVEQYLRCREQDEQREEDGQVERRDASGDE